MPCTGASQRSQQHAEMHLVTMRICVLVMLQLNKLRLLPVLMYRLGCVMSMCRKCLFPLVKHCFVGTLEQVLIALTHVLLVRWCCVECVLGILGVHCYVHYGAAAVARAVCKDFALKEFMYISNRFREQKTFFSPSRSSYSNLNMSV